MSEANEPDRSGRQGRPIEMPVIGTRWRHKGTGNAYVVTAAVKTEDPDDGEWMDAVGYGHPDAPKLTLWVRTLARFLERFEPVKEEG